MDAASFAPPFDPSQVQIMGEVSIDLPSPAYIDGQPPVPGGLARYAGETLLLLHFVLPNPGASILAPATGTVRMVDLDDALKTRLNGLTRLVELSPLPFNMIRVLRGLKGGLPTFYLGFTGGTMEDDDLVTQGDMLVQPAPSAHCYISVLFQDRVVLAPWAWATLLRDAMQAANQDVSAWNQFLHGLEAAALYANERGLRVLDAQGRPLAGTNFRWRTGPGSWQAITADATGKLALPAIGPGEQLTLHWLGDASEGEPSLPVQALYESGLSAARHHADIPLPTVLQLPADFQRGHLQVLELSRWFASFYRLNSRIEPLVDGIPTFKRLVDDLLASASKGNGAHFAGWAFKDFPLDEGRQGIDTHITALSQRIQNAGGETSFLVFKFLNLKQGFGTLEKDILALFYLCDGLLFLGALATSSVVGFAATLAGVFLGKDLEDLLFSKLEDKLEQSKDIFPKLNSNIENTAIWASNPAHLVDDPLYQAPLIPQADIEAIIDQFGSMHQKIQIIQLPGADGKGHQHIAYIGGIDINYDRLDTPGHHGKPYQDEKQPNETQDIVHPFHDVHARITGPAVIDVFQTWDERHAYHISKPQPIDKPPDVFSAPSEDQVNTQGSKHIVQIARTYHKPNPDPASPHTFFDFALDGEKTINDTVIKTMRAAREYIYIEDQYFTPNDGVPDSFFDVLLEARNCCKRLLILVPTETDQPFGDMRRRKLFGKLQDVANGWGDRVLIGAPLRRPVLYKATLTASKGRCILMNATGILEKETTLFIGPKARVPDSYPFWLWVEGELMLCYKQPQDGPDVPYPDDKKTMPTQAIEVLRGKSLISSSHSPTPRQHPKGAPVTIAQLKGIYVHSKTVIIDDLMVSIGSSNMNRRGLFFDAEIRAFAVPEQLKAAPDNPARALRTALWAEHLGLPPEMGASLLADPIAAFELFRRTHYEGNRFTPFDVLDFRGQHYSISLPAGSSVTSLLSDFVSIAESELVPNIWNDLSDPTSFSDPSPQPGP